MNHPLFYKASGRFSPAALVLMLGMGSTAGLLLGGLYGALGFYSPVIYLNAVVVGMVSLGLGRGVVQMARGVHLRHPLLAGACGAVTGLAAWYASWVAWIFVLGGQTREVLLLDPRELIHAAQQVARAGAWSLGGNGEPVTGGLLKGVWAVEALVLIGFAAVWTALDVARRPYSEKAQRWADQVHELPRLVAVEPAKRRAFKEALRGGRFGALGVLKPAREAVGSFTTCVGRTTSPPGDEVFLTLDAVDLGVNAKGQTTVQRERLVRNLAVDQAAWAVLSGFAVPAGISGNGPGGHENSPRERAAPRTSGSVYVPPVDESPQASPNGLPGMPPAA